jgi:hypothetical protein
MLWNRNYLFRLRIQIQTQTIFSIVFKINNFVRIFAFLMLLKKYSHLFFLFLTFSTFFIQFYFGSGSKFISGTESRTDPECILVQVPIPALVQVPVPHHWYFLNSYTVIYNKLCKNCGLVSNLNVGPVHGFQDSGV